VAYEIEGKLWKSHVQRACPCWVGRPRLKTCDTTIAWGNREGLDRSVSVDVHMAVSATSQELLIPKSGSRRLCRRAGDREQEGVLLQLFTGSSVARSPTSRAHRGVVPWNAPDHFTSTAARQAQHRQSRRSEMPRSWRHGNPRPGRDRLQHDPGFARLCAKASQYTRDVGPRHPTQSTEQTPPGPLRFAA